MFSREESSESFLRELQVFCLAISSGAHKTVRGVMQESVTSGSLSVSALWKIEKTSNKGGTG